MDLKDINPHLRFAQKVRYFPIPKAHCSLDHRIFYMISESCTLNINGTEYTPTAGTVILIPPGISYYFVREKHLKTININFDYNQDFSDRSEPFLLVESENFDASTIMTSSLFEKHLFLNQPLILNNMGYLKPKFDMIVDEYSYKKQFYEVISSAYLKSILLEMVRHVVCNEKSNKTVNEVLNYIHQHYAEEINNKTLSHVFGYHPYHLNRLMKSATGTTLHQYLINHRIEMAKKQLRETDLPILNIAEGCGYQNFSNFSTDFKKKNGLSPSAYRAESKLHL